MDPVLVLNTSDQSIRVAGVTIPPNVAAWVDPNGADVQASILTGVLQLWPNLSATADFTSFPGWPGGVELAGGSVPVGPAASLVAIEARARLAATQDLRARFDALVAGTVDLSAVYDAISAEQADRQTGDGGLSAAIAAAAAAADTAIAAETANRTAAVAALAAAVAARTIALTNEVEARTAGNATLTDLLDIERAQRIAADEALAENIATLGVELASVDAQAVTDEAAARTAADSALGARIDAEAAARAAAITGEAAARTAAITAAVAALVNGAGPAVDTLNELAVLLANDADAVAALISQLSALTAVVATKETPAGAQAKVDVETAARTAADSALGVRIDGETAARAAAVNTEQAARSAGDTANADAILTEALNRANADLALGVRIDGETAARTAAETAEQTARTNADNTEQTARLAGDLTNANALAAETAARIAALGPSVTLYDDFERPSGPPGVAPTGQVWATSGPGALAIAAGSGAGAGNQQVKCTANGFGYLGTTLNASPLALALRGTVAAGSVLGSALTMAASSNPDGTPGISGTINNCIHCFMSRLGVAIQKRRTTTGGSFIAYIPNVAASATTQTTVPIVVPWNADPAAFQALVDASPLAGLVRIGVTAWTFTFVGALALTDVADITVDPGGLSAGTVLQYTTVPGDASHNETQALAPSSDAAGSIVATIAGVPITIPIGSTVAAVQALINATSLNGKVTVGAGAGWNVTWIGALANTNIATMAIDYTGLTSMAGAQGGGAVYVTTPVQGDGTHNETQTLTPSATLNLVGVNFNTPLDPAVPHDFIVTYHGSTVTVSVDGAEIASYTDPDFLWLLGPNIFYEPTQNLAGYLPPFDGDSWSISEVAASTRPSPLIIPAGLAQLVLSSWLADHTAYQPSALIPGSGLMAFRGQGSAESQLGQYGNQAALILGQDGLARFARIAAGVAGMAAGDLYVPGAWNTGLFRFGNWRVWVDATGTPRIKNGAPASDLDGSTIASPAPFQVLDSARIALTDARIQVKRANATDVAVGVSLDADPQFRWYVRGDGLVGFSDGTNAADTFLSRLAAKVLGVQTDTVIRTGHAVTGSRPAAATAGAGGIYYDDTLRLLIVSDGTSWTPAAPLASPVFTTKASAPELDVTGTGGAGFVSLPAQSADPATPAAGVADIYARSTASREYPRFLGSLDAAPRRVGAIWDKPWSELLWSGTTSLKPTGFGNWLSTGTLTNVAATANGGFNQLATAAATNSDLSLLATAALRRGAAADLYAGFFAHGRLYFPDASYDNTGASTGTRIYGLLVALLSGGITDVTASDAPANRHFCGFRRLHVNGGVTDANWQFVTCDATTANVIDTGLAFTAQHVYTMSIWCPAGSTRIYWQIDDKTAGTTASGSTTSNLPGATAVMAAYGALLRTIDAVARNVQFDRVYWETDRG